jgi:hypothetical protein
MDETRHEYSTWPKTSREIQADNEKVDMWIILTTVLLTRPENKNFKMKTDVVSKTFC